MIDSPTLLEFENQQFFRFVSERWFEAQPNRFFLNFLDSRRSFTARHRLSGSNNSCGFYFSPILETAMMETMFYAGIDKLGTNDPLALLNHAALAPSILLTCTFQRLQVIDLREVQNAEWLLSKYGVFDDDQRRGRWDAFDYLELYCDPVSGGGDYAALLGWFAGRDGYPGIAFPSRRALDCSDNALWTDKSSPRCTSQDTFLGRRNDWTGVGDCAMQQMRSEYNVVVYRGSRVTRSIVNYTVLHRDGSRTCADNPFYDVDPVVVEDARLREARRLSLSPDDASMLGLVHDEDLNAMYVSQDIWIKRVTPAR